MIYHSFAKYFESLLCSSKIINSCVLFAWVGYFIEILKRRISAYFTQNCTFLSRKNEKTHDEKPKGQNI